MPKLQAYLETGRKRTFAGAVEWPGWCRSGRDEAAALLSLISYGPRYAPAMGSAAEHLVLPVTDSDLEVVERLQGNATTDFGAPDASPAIDDTPITAPELDRWTSLLEAAWAAFDRTAADASGVTLRKGPRGGGREVDAIVRHVLDADAAYVRQLGGRYRAAPDIDVREAMNGVRSAFLEALRARSAGDPLPESRRTSKVWSPRYAIRRSAWHALDHAWEIEDRAAPLE
jgi:hypothetical protein